MSQEPFTVTDITHLNSYFKNETPPRSRTGLVYSREKGKKNQWLFKPLETRERTRASSLPSSRDAADPDESKDLSSPSPPEETDVDWNLNDRPACEETECV